MKYRLVTALAALLICAGCVADENQSVDDVIVVDGFAVAEVFDGLLGPTQINVGPDGSLLVAQLNGGENDETGQILVVDLDEGSTEVLYEGLDKPTGVALLDDSVYVMERNRLSVGTLDADPLQVVVDELPTNGRSEGTLTVTPQQTLLYNTSGSIRNGEVVEDSGQLWELSPGEDPVVFAAGFKNAYAHYPSVGNQFWVTEISDGSFDREPASDEVVVVGFGDDGGWPSCVGDQRPVEEFGGSAQSCASSVESVAVFESGATPTSITVAPWDDGQLLVALWNENRVVSLNLDDTSPVNVETFLEGFEHPQHVLTSGELLLVTDPDRGRILSVTKT